MFCQELSGRANDCAISSWNIPATARKDGLMGRQMLRIKLIAAFTVGVLTQGYAEPIMKGRAITIGAPLPLSGSAATWGQDVRDTIIFANDKLAGGNYRIIFEDDQCDSKHAVSAAQKLLAIDKITHAIGFACTAATLPVASLYRRKGVIMMVTVASAEAVSNLAPYAFRSIPDDKEASAVLFRHTSQKNVKKLGILSLQNDYCFGFRDNLKQLAAGSGVQIVTEDYTPDTVDFRSLLGRLRQQKTDAIFINSGFEGDFAQIVEQIAELRWEVSKYGAYYPGTPSVLKRSGAALENTIYVDLPSLDEVATDEGKKLYEEYLTRFGPIRSMPILFATTFEGFRALHDAIMSNEDIKKYLSTRTFTGIFGPYSFNDKGNIIGLTHVLRSIQDGKPVPIMSNPKA
jgi:branched-chain amino acid transport system substrate-binding protein